MSVEAGAPGRLPEQEHFPASQKRVDQKLLAFLKEWGGIATVLIAILYTFPFEVFDRLVNWEMHDVSAARSLLSDAISLSTERLVTLDRVNGDAQTKDFISNGYLTRIYNVLVSNRSTFLAAADKLAPSELMALGSNFVLAGLAPEALPYYQLAAKKAAGDEGTLGSINRELGSTLFGDPRVRNVEKAREAYLFAIRVASKQPETLPLYTQFLSELAQGELQQGDWKCGQDLRVQLRPVYQLLISKNQYYTGMAQFFENSANVTTKRPEQASKGCPYTVPSVS